MQTLLEIVADQNSTIVFPLPMDLLEPFLARTTAETEADRTARTTTSASTFRHCKADC